MQSEVDRIKEQIAQEYKAAKSGLPLADPHERVTMRMENIQQLYEQLIMYLGEYGAIEAIMAVGNEIIP